MRLIDADELKKALAEMWYESAISITGVSVAELIDNTPTIEPCKSTEDERGKTERRGRGMKCRNCKDFRICYQPLKVGRDCYDSGLAECKRYDLVVDFTSGQKLNRLTCVEEQEGYYKDKAEGRVIE